MLVDLGRIPKWVATNDITERAGVIPHGCLGQFISLSLFCSPVSQVSERCKLDMQANAFLLKSRGLDETTRGKVDGHVD